MVERGHDDGVGIDEQVAYEYAKVRRHYSRLRIPERTAIEFFAGGHEIHGRGTFAFLDRHLSWTPQRAGTGPKPVSDDLKPLQGEWTILSNVVNGTVYPKDLLAKARIIIKGDKMTVKPQVLKENGTFRLGGPEGFTVRIKLDVNQKPRHLDVEVKRGGKVTRESGIFDLEGDRLRICFGPKERPTDFTSKAGSGRVLLVLRRAKK
jgi:uncharacterized protein (TIGR03067 family)